MLSSFWDGVGGKLADRWAAVATPALVFWLGGLLAYAYSRGGLSTVTHWLDGLSTPAQVGVLGASLLGVAASGVLVQRLTAPGLRFLEGYWPASFDRLRLRLIRRQVGRAGRDDAAWQKLAPIVLGGSEVPGPAQLSAFARLDQRRRRRPEQANLMMPTRVGNILRATELRPRDKYGLDAVVVWPRLWLVLPDSTRQELLSARAGLDGAVGATIWGVLFCVFSVWTPWCVLIGLVFATLAVTGWVPARAAGFGDLLEAAYDVHRLAVYQQLRWPLPRDPHHEHSQGERLTRYLWRGSDDDIPTFTPPVT